MSARQKLYGRRTILSVAILASFAGAIVGAYIVKSTRDKDSDNWKFIAKRWKNLYEDEQHQASNERFMAEQWRKIYEMQKSLENIETVNEAAQDRRNKW